MKHADSIHIYSNKQKKSIELIKNATLIFALDFNDISRIDDFKSHVVDSNAYKILIDHHPDPGDHADLIISQTAVSSTAELVYSFIQLMSLTEYIDTDIAECIYCGIMTDTGCFSFNSSYPETFQSVAELMNYGIKKDKIYDLVYDNFSYNRMRCVRIRILCLPWFSNSFILSTWCTVKFISNLIALKHFKYT
ncbi:hypothetical protein ES703_124661 [subsurface metagenome]